MLLQELYSGYKQGLITFTKERHSAKTLIQDLKSYFFHRGIHTTYKLPSEYDKGIIFSLEKQTLRPDFTGDSSKIKTKANQTNS